jgi:hypothetical protein
MGITLPCSGRPGVAALGRPLFQACFQPVSPLFAGRADRLYKNEKSSRRVERPNELTEGSAEI